MKISVIIPVYNVENYLKKCVDSVLAQDFDDCEILLIDDGSTDSSGQICDEYGNKYPQIKVVHQENKGLGGARNTGIKAATGKYLLFVDSDDFIKSDMLNILYKTAEDTAADVVLFGADFVDEQGNVLAVRMPLCSEKIITKPTDQFLLYCKDTCAWDKLFRRSLFTENDIYFPERIWYEDLCVAGKIVLYAEKTSCIKKSFYNYLQRSDSIMHVKNTDRNIDMLTVVSEVLSFYRTRGCFDENRDALCFLAVMHIMVLCTLRVASEDTKHPLLKKFYDFTKTNFNDFKTNKFVKDNLSKRHRIIFWFSKHKFYLALKLLDRLNRLR
ncbi:MAG: glycosyltransferase [Clostridia bacterium]|nr:glycosyltransferase [Clostridia bacterium]